MQFLFFSSLYRFLKIIQIKGKFIWTFSVHIWKGRDYMIKAKRILHKYNKIQETESKVMLFGVQI